MCGIAGIFNYAEPERPLNRGLLVRMTRALEHRGPDDEGFYVEGPIGLGHRRLTIVDLTPTGHQPMPNAHRSGWITYNGEFYNHAMFRARLLSQGHVFRGTSDTETLLHLIEEEGPDALQDVAGIFAFAYWDGLRQELTLARDPLGVKQVYYHDDGRRIIFASEIKALLQCPDVPRELDMEAINQYLHFHTALFDRTFFKQIKQLRAGEYLQVSRARARSRVYWKVEDFQPRQGTPEAQVAELSQLLEEVVGDQLMSDVPVGSFFSGGIDSTAVAAMAARAGKPPICFGIHFTDQGVVDERPFQEAAAKALGLDLRLITLDGSSFPEDLMTLTYYQDQPVIGAAMFPMHKVSRLAADHVKVCLGGQAADEIFGGYARYGLARPWQVVKSWFAGKDVQSKVDSQNGKPAAVGGNLWLQIADRRNMRRLVSNVPHLATWQARYFEHFAKVSESDWSAIFSSPKLVSRGRCYQIFRETIAASPATDPADQAMHWDMQTYLTGLFQQDDRMSMACSLESRVPLADPRLVRFAFHTGFDLKFRTGATKWALRQAVAGVLPEFVLNRRKIGFDTPAERWMKGPHAGFVRDLLLSSEARDRGLWNQRELASWLDQPNRPHWFDVVWKAISIEAWAKVFLAQPERLTTSRDDLAAVTLEDREEGGTVRNAVQEIRELGISGTISRAAWELKQRSGLGELIEPGPPKRNGLPANQIHSHGARRLAQVQPNGTSPVLGVAEAAALQIESVLPSFDPHVVADAMRERIPVENVSRLQQVALDAVHGRILCFGRWTADFGRPIDWHLNPISGKRWNAKAHWSKATVDGHGSEEVKFTWEPARFPQAYTMARAAAFAPELRSEFAKSLADQIEDFVRKNPFGRGVHWNSGQEIAIRLMAWTFSLNVLMRLGERMDATAATVLNATYEGAVHIERNLQYAKAVDNNHLLSEALGLYLAGHLLPNVRESEDWRQQASAILEAEAGRQFDMDGGYIMQSHNYHRSVLQIYVWAFVLCRANGQRLPAAWNQAMSRSLDFLFSQQNPADGRLPNYGANDGALPSVLSTCDFSDFRPVLQVLSVATRGERIYEAGPWDEATAWLLGPEGLNVPLRKPTRKSISFGEAGLHVLRGNDPATFAVLRCGSVRARFSQIDMLHLDVWWRGLNILVDGGSYQYNGAEKWHKHFVRTASHNTIQIDHRDQMLHYRPFKNLYWTKASLIQFEDNIEFGLCAGEHYGFQRHSGNCVHRRSVLFVKDDLWVVCDRISGSGTHHARLHWLAGDFSYQYDEAEGRVSLETEHGPFSILTVGADGKPLDGSLLSGQDNPPRGWVSRYYGEKAATPSLVVERDTTLPFTFVTVLGAGKPLMEINDGVWSVETQRVRANFRISDDGLIVPKLEDSSSRESP